MNYSITHRTLYEYAAPVTVSHHVARLEPRATATQAREKFHAENFSRTGAAQGAPGLFRQPALLFHHPGNPQPAGNHHAQPRDGERPKTAARPKPSPAWEEVAELFRDPVSPEVVEPYQFVFDSPQVRASLELADYARESFPQGHAAAGGRARI